jgi:peptidoglycan LD-endopeptidase LytH
VRARTFAAFVIGFVVGVAVLAAGLWFGGRLNVPRAAAPQTPAASGVAAARPSPVGIGMASRAEAPRQPPSVPQPELPQTVLPLEPTTGEAERSFPEDDLDHPIVPVSGVSANKIRDTFYDNRDGHEYGALDIPAARGTPVIAAVEGYVVKLFHSDRSGTTVYQFDDSNRFCYFYADLDSYASGLKEGAFLHQGQPLGYVGSSGNAPPATPHLHFAVFRLGPDKSWWKGTAIDPLPLLR